MNAPYDGERDRAASYDDDTAAGSPPPEPRPAAPAPPAYPRTESPYAESPYAGDPYDHAAPHSDQPWSYHQPQQPAQPYGGPQQAPQPYGAPQQSQQPVQPAAPYGRQPPPPYGTQPYGDRPYQQTPAGPAQGAPGQGGGNPWAPTAPGPGGPAEQDPAAGPTVDATAPLFRDQRDAGIGPEQGYAFPDFTDAPDEPEPEPAPASSGGGRAASLMKSSAVMAAGTLVSRLTGFLRTLVIGGAIGVSTLNDSYQVANTLPTMIYILVGGGALNAVFIPQLVRAMKDDEDGGEAYANRLLTLVVVGLAAVTTVMVVGAPVLVRLMSPKIASDPASMAVTVSFTRYCLPTMFFMGVHVVLGQILNARGRFGAMMWTPVLNNIVVIAGFGAYIWVFGTARHSNVDAATISPEGVRLLGIATLLGLTVQALSMIPYLRESGLRIRPRFDWRGHGLGHAAKLAKWTFLFVLANQVGMTVVIQLATWAGAVASKQGHPGTGITAYNYALLLWQMPQAIITVSVMTAVLPRISRAAADGDAAAVRDDLSYGLRTSAVAIVPAAFAFLALGVPLATMMYSSAGEAGAHNIGYVLMAFGLGLIPYSIQYVVLRGFYAYEDTRTPFYNTVIVAVVNAAASGICFAVLPARWAVVGMAGSYGLAYIVGVGVAVRRLRKRLGGDLDGPHVVRTYARLIGASLPAALLGGAVAYGITGVLGDGFTGSLAAVVGGGIVLLAVFYLAARRMRIEEMTAMVGMVRGRLGR
ncbi:murein biosynthesis integral membrane protein MurJ [Streptomyces sp. SL13]|uniref:Murein biosynthesis integral membrane protein MurJ n=1 Tax=Streptantibioticus silvisoli TaxID=2705255 RepID=A0AA90H556_9ACTN|nr:murein biosynthesis integral membrane protein MurJ [Streptantibioticus silvisoli]MDI5961912.1 murein biosynthesis integral membrane protein MurJ [Streptantibioticus silvisoli]MDI5970547.1 murein biosynthesis integral membrane protein MurJ [Streptantibioticus silvisoli]